MLRILLILLFALPIGIRAQRLTLTECREAARRNYPMARQYGLIEQSRDYNLSNAAKAWLPQVSVAAGGFAFTDILDESTPAAQGGLSMNNAMAGGSISISQTLYDGGQTAARKQTVRDEAETERRSNDITLYEVETRAEEIFFSILLLDEQLRQNQLWQDDLTLSKQNAESRLRNGMATTGDIDLIAVEQLKAKQQRVALDSSREAYLRMLSAFVGRQLPATTQLDKPEAGRASAAWDESLIARPELNLYAAQTQLLESRRKQLDTRLRPTLSAFAAGLGHTDLTSLMHNGAMLGGITVSWNIGALYTRKNDLRNLDVQRRQIETQRQTFLFNNRLEHEQTNGTIGTLSKQIELDQSIVDLRESLRQQSEQKASHGTETTHELLRSINAAQQARQQKALHEIQLLQETHRLQRIHND